MVSSRETIYGGLFSLTQTALNGLDFKTMSRRSRLWTDVSPEEMPALFMRQVKEVSIKERGTPPKRELHVDLILYVYAGPEPDALADPLINAALDRIDKMFPSLGPVVQNMNIPGVSEVRIVGDIEMGDGQISGQGIAIVPIVIVAV